MKIEFTVPFRRVPAPGTLLVERSRDWVTFPRRALRKSWFWCIWRRRSRNTFCFSPRVTLGSSPSWSCARSRVSRAGIGSMRCLSDGSSPALDRHRDVFAM